MTNASNAILFEYLLRLPSRDIGSLASASYNFSKAISDIESNQLIWKKKFEYNYGIVPTYPLTLEQWKQLFLFLEEEQKGNYSLGYSRIKDVEVLRFLEQVLGVVYTQKQLYQIAIQAIKFGNNNLAKDIITEYGYENYLATNLYTYTLEYANVEMEEFIRKNLKKSINELRAFIIMNPKRYNFITFTTEYPQLWKTINLKTVIENTFDEKIIDSLSDELMYLDTDTRARILVPFLMNIGGYYSKIDNPHYTVTHVGPKYNKETVDKYINKWMLFKDSASILETLKTIFNKSFKDKHYSKEGWLPFAQHLINLLPNTDIVRKEIQVLHDQWKKSKRHAAFAQLLQDKLRK